MGLDGETLTTSLHRVRARRPPDWLIEERRASLGHWAAFCLGCGHTLRFFDDSVGDLPGACPQCAGEIRSACPACGARFASAFAVECEGCGAALRGDELFGVAIRRASD
jgi:predicted amidophosphoribosyltransferase